MEEKLSGVLIVRKPSGITSHDVVGKIRKLFGTKQVGHTGTLDPMATGVLVVLVGRAAKASEYLSVHDKCYRATMHLGMTTDTQDSTGTVLSATDNTPSFDAVQAVCKQFVGDIQQIPPMYSALKVNGQKLVDLARKGQIVERDARSIHVYSITCKATDTPLDYVLDIHCSSGTYVRTLCHDIGQQLGCGAIMATLERTTVGQFDIQNSYSLEQITEMDFESRPSLLLPVETLFRELPSVTLPKFYADLCKNGCEIYQSKIAKELPNNTPLEVGSRCTLWRLNADQVLEFFALGETKSYPDGLAIKAIKFFVI